MTRSRAGATAAYATLAVVWGTTYNAIRLAVESFNPFFYSGVRFLASGLILAAAARIAGVRFPRTFRELWPMVLTGVMLLLLGNGLLSIAAMHVQSGIASVISPLAPVLIALMVYLVPGEERLDPLGWAGVLVGFGGVALLFGDKVAAGFRLGPGELLLVGCCLSWSAASVIQRRFAVRAAPLATASVQMLSGGLGLSIVAPFWGPPLHAPLTAAAAGALAYLILIGGCVGFFCWAYLLTRVPVARASTYGYFNPAVALLVGAVWLGESFETHQLGGMALTILGVSLVHLGARGRPGVSAAPPPVVISAAPPAPRHGAYEDKNRTPEAPPGGSPAAGRDPA